MRKIGERTYEKNESLHDNVVVKIVIVEDACVSLHEQKHIQMILRSKVLKVFSFSLNASGEKGTKPLCTSQLIGMLAYASNLTVSLC